MAHKTVQLEGTRDFCSKNLHSISQRKKLSQRPGTEARLPCWHQQLLFPSPLARGNHGRNRVLALNTRTPKYVGHLEVRWGDALHHTLVTPREHTSRYVPVYPGINSDGSPEQICMFCVCMESHVYVCAFASEWRPEGTSRGHPLGTSFLVCEIANKNQSVKDSVVLFWISVPLRQLSGLSLRWSARQQQLCSTNASVCFPVKS